MTIPSVEQDRVISHGKPMGPKLRIAIVAFLTALFAAMITTLLAGSPTTDPQTARISMSQPTAPTNPSGNP
ncbi:hypothetical protein ACP4J4_16580 [Aureimonas ureilytica]|uniref:hypothetical protein n=1 Tax=Aureimonas ureilytica TaxID=401562 RepID=UPI003CE6EABD